MFKSKKQRKIARCIALHSFSFTKADLLVCRAERMQKKVATFLDFVASAALGKEQAASRQRPTRLINPMAGRSQIYALH